MCQLMKTRMKARIVPLLVLLLAGGWVSGQTQLEGRVVDEQGEALPGVNIVLHQNGLGTMTDTEGGYRLRVAPELRRVDVLFSFVGYKPHLASLCLDGASSTVRMDVVLVATPLELEEITVTAGFLQSREAVPYPISTMLKREVALAGSANFTEVLARTPGVYAISLGNGVGKPVLRGLSNANLVMLNDGAKLENFNFSASHPFLLDELSAGRVEIIKGPASLQYGSDAVAGVVNVLGERPEQPGALSGELLAVYSSNTGGYQGSLALKGASEALFFSLRGSTKSHGDFTDGQGGRVFNTRFNEDNLSATVGTRQRLGNFSLNYHYTTARYGLQNASLLALLAARPELLAEGRENQLWFQDLENQVVGSKNTIFVGGATLDLDLAYQSNSRELVAGGLDTQGQALVRPTTASMRLATVSYNARLNLPLDQKKIIVGLNGANIRNQADETKPGNPLLDSDIDDLGAYALADLSLSERLQLSGGLRFDHRGMRSYPVATPTTEQFLVDRGYDSFSGSLGFSFNFSPQQFLKLNVARGFRSPTMPELTQNGIHGSRYERGDPGLRAQANVQLDLNYHWHTPWLVIDLSPFYNRIDNYIYVVMTDLPAPIGQGMVFQHVQDDAVFAGGELAMDIHPSPWLGLHASYSMVRASIEGGGPGVEHPTFIPPDRLTAELKFSCQELAFLHKPFASFGMARLFDQDQVGQNEAATPGYTLFNARLETNIKVSGNEWTFFLQANNLFDRAYIDHLSITKQLELNMMGRNILFGARLSFNKR